MMMDLFDRLLNRQHQAKEQNIRHARFGAANPFKRVREALRGRHRQVRRADPPELKAPMDKTRQLARHFLFRAAMAQVNKRNSTERTVGGRRCWWNIMPRAERRKLARAYAAGEWRRLSPARGLLAA